MRIITTNGNISVSGNSTGNTFIVDGNRIIVNGDKIYASKCETIRLVVEGNVHSGGSVSCENIRGSVGAGGSVSASRIG